MQYLSVPLFIQDINDLALEGKEKEKQKKKNKKKKEKQKKMEMRNNERWQRKRQGKILFLRKTGPNKGILIIQKIWVSGKRKYSLTTLQSLKESYPQSYSRPCEVKESEKFDCVIDFFSFQCQIHQNHEKFMESESSHRKALTICWLSSQNPSNCSVSGET